MPSSKRRPLAEIGVNPPPIPLSGRTHVTRPPRRLRSSTATSAAMLPPITAIGSAATDQLQPHFGRGADAALELDQPEVGHAMVGGDAEVEELTSGVEGMPDHFPHQQVHRRSGQLVDIAPV